MFKKLVFFFFIVWILFGNARELFGYEEQNLAQLSQDRLQAPNPIDIDKIDFSKLTNEEYTRLIMKLQESDQRPLIKNLSIF